MEGNENKVLVPGRMLNPSDSDVYLKQKVIIIAQAKLLSKIEFEDIIKRKKMKLMRNNLNAQRDLLESTKQNGQLHVLTNCSTQEKE